MLKEGGGGWPIEGRERVSTHVILVNEFRGFFYFFIFFNEYFSSYCSALVCLFSRLPLLRSESLI